MRCARCKQDRYGGTVYTVFFARQTDRSTVTTPIGQGSIAYQTYRTTTRTSWEFLPPTEIFLCFRCQRQITRWKIALRFIPMLIFTGVLVYFGVNLAPYVADMGVGIFIVFGIIGALLLAIWLYAITLLVNPKSWEARLFPQPTPDNMDKTIQAEFTASKYVQKDYKARGYPRVLSRYGVAHMSRLK